MFFHFHSQTVNDLVYDLVSDLAKYLVTNVVDDLVNDLDLHKLICDRQSWPFARDAIASKNTQIL